MNALPYTTEACAVIAQAGDLARKLARIKDEIERNLTAAAVARVLSDALDGDAQCVMLNAAGDLQGEAVAAVERIQLAGGPTRDWHREHSPGYGSVLLLQRQELLAQVPA